MLKMKNENKIGGTFHRRHTPPEFPIVSGTLEEPVRESEEPNVYNVQFSEEIFLRIPQ